MNPVIVMEGKVIKDNLKEYLGNKGSISKVYSSSVHLSAFYGKIFGFEGGELPVTEKMFEQILALPMYPTLQERYILYH